MDQLLIFSKKYGVTGLLVVWLWWTNERLSKVENELYICYQNSYNKPNTQSRLNYNSTNFAILPKREDYVKTVNGGNA